MPATGGDGRIGIAAFLLLAAGVAAVAVARRRDRDAA